jgi:hypothetical protein
LFPAFPGLPACENEPSPVSRLVRGPMALELHMVGVIVENMPRALEFVQRLGVDVPEGADGGVASLHAALITQCPLPPASFV